MNGKKDYLLVGRSNSSNCRDSASPNCDNVSCDNVSCDNVSCDFDDKATTKSDDKATTKSVNKRKFIKDKYSNVNWNQELKEYSSMLWECLLFVSNSKGGYFPSEVFKDGKKSIYDKWVAGKVMYCKSICLDSFDYFYVLDREYQNRHKRLSLFNARLKWVMRKECFFLTFEKDNNSSRMKKRGQKRAISDETFKRRVIEFLNTFHCDYILYADHFKSGGLHYHCIMNYQGLIDPRLWKYGNLDLGLKKGKIPAIFSDDGFIISTDYKDLDDKSIRVYLSSNGYDDNEIDNLLSSDDFVGLYDLVNDLKITNSITRFNKAKNYLVKYDIQVNHYKKESVNNSRIIYSPSLKSRSATLKLMNSMTNKRGYSSGPSHIN